MANMEQLYQQRLDRYTTALRNEQPDRVPIRPFVAEFTGTYAGYTCQELAHDYENAFAAARKCASDFEWDAVVPNMLATWTGMPWEEKRATLPPIQGDEALCERIWQSVDASAAMYIWWIALAF